MAPTRRRGRPPTDVVAQGERRSEIIATAQQLFTQSGYAAVSLGQIADEVGVTKSALYNHFASKEALYAEVVCSLMASIAEAIRRVADAPLSTAERLREIAGHALVRIPVRSRIDEMMRDVAEHLSTEERALVTTAHGQMLDAMTAVMQRGVDAGELRADLPADFLATSFLMLVSGYQGHHHIREDAREPEQLPDRVVSLFLEGAGRR
ncbi:AcrR family transcriptional regulator [Symbiobacterium terraclitae]|uniref:AcrR family transcriptional regulator n=1 Tax=Symbiobacterium terraclitae TaxID=557451 RepID=A0ABS4JWV1_9FIRM|nr:AcrR family transcriptional regulator [Symbiobacterium terraclitae]